MWGLRPAFEVTQARFARFYLKFGKVQASSLKGEEALVPLVELPGNFPVCGIPICSYGSPWHSQAQNSLWRASSPLQPHLGQVARHQLCGLLSLQVKQTLGLKGLFLRGPKPGSLDSHVAGQPPPRPSVSQRLLRRTASAPTKSQKPSRKGFPELALGTQDAGSEGAADDVAPPSPNPALEPPTQERSGSSSPRGKAPAEEATEERVPAQVRSLHAPEGPGPAGMAATCMKCVVGSCTGMDIEGLQMEQPPSPGPAGSHTAISQQPMARVDSLGGTCCSLSPRATPGRSREAPKGPRARRQGPGSGSVSLDSSSPDSPGSPKVAPCQPEGSHRQQGALQGEMNALFVQKLEEIRSRSPMFSTGKACHSSASHALYARHAQAVRALGSASFALSA